MSYTQKCYLFLEGMKEMWGFNENTGHVKVSGFPARLRPSTLGCIEIFNAESIMVEYISAAYQDHIKRNSDQMLKKHEK